MKSDKLTEARLHLDEAIKTLELANAKWTECVSSLHMAEINLKTAQSQMRKSYNALVEVINS